MRLTFQNYKFQFFLLGIASIWLFLVIFLLQINKQVLLFGDSRSYFFAAQELIFQHKLNSHRPIVISFINGIPLLLGLNKGYIFIWSLIINLFCWFTTILLIYSIVKEFASNKIAFIIALLYVFCIGNLFITFHLLSESIFIALLVFVIYLIQRYLNTKKIALLIVSIATLVLSIMIKPLVSVLVLLLTLFFIKEWKKLFFSKFSIFIFISLFILFFQMFGLKKQYGNYTVSYIDSFTYYNYIGTRANCLKDNTEFLQGKGERYYYFSKLSDFEQKKVAYIDLMQQIKFNKINLIKAYFINLFINSTKASTAVFMCENIDTTSYFEGIKFFLKAVSKIQNCIFTCLGILMSIYFLIKKRSKLLNKIISFVILYVVAISAISSDQGDRFHIVIYPLILILTANFLHNKTKHSFEPLQK
jgi:hypothetical protein